MDWRVIPCIIQTNSNIKAPNMPNPNAAGPAVSNPEPFPKAFLLGDLFVI